MNAGIAQLVEHDLAKVGVASSSLVSRSLFYLLSFLLYPGGEMVDTQDLKSCDCEVVRVQVPLRVLTGFTNIFPSDISFLSIFNLLPSKDL